MGRLFVFTLTVPDLLDFVFAEEQDEDAQSEGGDSEDCGAYGGTFVFVF